jgi:hypothetical protein
MLRQSATARRKRSGGGVATIANIDFSDIFRFRAKPQ